MKGIYLTEERKKAIEDEIVELEKHIENVIKIAQIASDEKNKTYLEVEFKSKILTYKEILSSATTLPVEKNWDGVFNKTFSQAYIEKDYPDGVIIIQPKQ